jgi:hypothetical protein
VFDQCTTDEIALKLSNPSKFCKKGTDLWNWQRVKAIIKGTNRKFQCQVPFCHFVGTTRDKYVQHNYTCLKSFVVKQELFADHYPYQPENSSFIKLNSGDYFCHCCGYRTVLKDMMWLHMQLDHDCFIRKFWGVPGDGWLALKEFRATSFFKDNGDTSWGNLGPNAVKRIAAEYEEEQKKSKETGKPFKTPKQKRVAKFWKKSVAIMENKTTPTL